MSGELPGHQRNAHIQRDSSYMAKKAKKISAYGLGVYISFALLEPLSMLSGPKDVSSGALCLHQSTRYCESIHSICDE